MITILSDASEWIVTCHVHPDGDALGSASAFLTTGRELGKKVVWGGPDAFPSNYSFIKGSESFRENLTLEELRPGTDSVVVALDTANRARSLKDISSLPKDVPLLNIDHHADNELFGSVNYVDPSASSTGEIVWMLFKEWGVSMSIDVLESLYTAISTDCGSFSFSCTTARTHRIAAEMLEAGVSPAKMNKLIRSGSSLQALHLRGVALSRAFISSGFAAFTWLEERDFSNTGAERSETEFIVGELFSVKDTEFAAFFVEDEDGVRVSLRSRGPVEASEIARLFGGGGHRQAAGCILPRPLSRALETVRNAVEGKYAQRTASSE
ncbi:MAG: bifunctional oligoribonuclease/PAP phosphatase NrnA [Synergistaceae bacterium]|nr:bifunctional oligoribonuclease/PAP phosphatase NrnA [Synergistota bacterium]NLM72271.1 bifunctional oligoribonuclease/PAP phosphatase NrnA [Synergistaceae bacterium]